MKNMKSVTIRLEFGSGVRQQCHARFSKVQRTGYIITRILQGLHSLDIGTVFICAKTFVARVRCNSVNIEDAFFYNLLTYLEILQLLSFQMVRFTV